MQTVGFPLGNVSGRQNWSTVVGAGTLVSLGSRHRGSFWVMEILCMLTGWVTWVHLS